MCSSVGFWCLTVRHRTTFAIFDGFRFPLVGADIVSPEDRATPFSKIKDGFHHVPAGAEVAHHRPMAGERHLGSGRSLVGVRMGAPLVDA